MTTINTSIASICAAPRWPNTKICSGLGVCDLVTIGSGIDQYQQYQCICDAGWSGHGDALDRTGMDCNVHATTIRILHWIGIAVGLPLMFYLMIFLYRLRRQHFTRAHPAPPPVVPPVVAPLITTPSLLPTIGNGGMNNNGYRRSSRPPSMDLTGMAVALTIDTTGCNGNGNGNTNGTGTGATTACPVTANHVTTVPVAAATVVDPTPVATTTGAGGCAGAMVLAPRASSSSSAMAPAPMTPMLPLPSLPQHLQLPSMPPSPTLSPHHAPSSPIVITPMSMVGHCHRNSNGNGNGQIVLPVVVPQPSQPSPQLHHHQTRRVLTRQPTATWSHSWCSVPWDAPQRALVMAIMYSCTNTIYFSIRLAYPHAIIATNGGMGAAYYLGDSYFCFAAYALWIIVQSVIRPLRLSASHALQVAYLNRVMKFSLCLVPGLSMLPIIWITGLVHPLTPLVFGASVCCLAAACYLVVIVIRIFGARLITIIDTSMSNIQNPGGGGAAITPANKRLAAARTRIIIVVRAWTALGIMSGCAFILLGTWPWLRAQSAYLLPIMWYVGILSVPFGTWLFTHHNDGVPYHHGGGGGGVTRPPSFSESHHDPVSIHAAGISHPQQPQSQPQLHHVRNGSAGGHRRTPSNGNGGTTGGHQRTRSNGGSTGQILFQPRHTAPNSDSSTGMESDHHRQSLVPLVVPLVVLPSVMTQPLHDINEFDPHNKDTTSTHGLASATNVGHYHNANHHPSNSEASPLSPPTLYLTLGKHTGRQVIPTTIPPLVVAPLPSLPSPSASAPSSS